MKRISLLILISFILINICHSRSKRVDQIPNGSVNGCLNCHIAYGGDSLTDFGSDIFSNYLDNTGSAGNVIWGSALAGLDSDGDGFTNGWELGDPDGNWTSGSSNPNTLVTNPGNASSLDIADETKINQFKLEQNYPNPFNPATNISYQLPINSKVVLTIFDINGNKIKELINDYQPAGHKSVSWNGTNNNGQSVSGGVYVYTLRAGNYHKTQKMLMIK